MARVTNYVGEPRDASFLRPHSPEIGVYPECCDGTIPAGEWQARLGGMRFKSKDE